ncbi:MAG: YHS domain-containing protein [Candidatus Brocadia sp.]|nr:YHS domain-containing protein [Candidatus Brocadia sp.]
MPWFYCCNTVSKGLEALLPGNRKEEYKGKGYYFCAEHCKKIFKKAPLHLIEKKNNNLVKIQIE